MLCVCVLLCVVGVYTVKSLVVCCGFEGLISSLSVHGSFFGLLYWIFHGYNVKDTAGIAISSFFLSLWKARGFLCLSTTRGGGLLVALHYAKESLMLMVIPCLLSFVVLFCEALISAVFFFFFLSCPALIR